MTTKRVKIPLMLIVPVDACEDADDGPPNENVFRSAADLLVTVEGIAPGRTEKATIHVDGHGKTKVTFNLGDIELAGDPTLVAP